MSVVNKKWMKWQKIAGISVICGLAVAGCSRSDDTEDSVETADVTTEQPIVNEGAVAPAFNCDDPMVQDRLKNALKNTLNQQAQNLVANYANNAEISLNSGTVSDKVNGILIDVQNATVLQEANANGLTTCQASVSMTLPSEDLYQASQITAANNQPSLQTRLAQDNIRINNNMLVDESFTYVVGVQNGQVQVRIAGQPALITAVADVMAGSVFKSAMDVQRSAEERPRRREPTESNNQKSNQNKPVRPPTPKPVTPTEPVRPVEPATPPTINLDGNENSDQSDSQVEATPNTNNKAPASNTTSPILVPKDDSIDMVIIEDDSAIY